MPILEIFNNILEMDKNERALYIKKLSTNNVEELKEIIGLPLRASIKRLCDDFEIRAQFIRSQKKCPGPDCPMCNGEVCSKCGAGLFTRNPDEPHCEHDVLERHEGIYK